MRNCFWKLSAAMKVSPDHLHPLESNGRKRWHAVRHSYNFLSIADKAGGSPISSEPSSPPPEEGTQDAIRVLVIRRQARTGTKTEMGRFTKEGNTVLGGMLYLLFETTQGDGHK